ncbi:MAG: tyrosine-type recombinase/integrase [Nanoarchaeota archaeon]|nr:tyrosine-type recombinase/integrase [Nanoarchaeota archaeon]
MDSADVLEKIKKEGFRRKLSSRTVKAYCYHVKRFLEWSGKDPKSISKKDVREYMESISDKTGNTLNVVLNSIRFMIEEVMNRSWKLNIKYSKTPKKLPVVLTKEEIRGLLDAIENPKHKLMVLLMYSAGLRVSELVNLRAEHLDIDNNIGWVRNGKGGKDRMFIIADKVKEGLGKTVGEGWVFKSWNGSHLTAHTIYNIIKDACRKAKIKKDVSPHTLRHSFATHLIENGYDVCSVQSLLGHGSSQTTMVYVHTAKPTMIKVKSPLDEI